MMSAASIQTRRRRMRCGSSRHQQAAFSRAFFGDQPNRPSCLSESAVVDPLLRESRPARSHRHSNPIIQVFACPALRGVVARLDQRRRNDSQRRERADRVADRLCELADEHGSVLVVGHGMFNRFVATPPAGSAGWSGPGMLPREHWSIARFVQNL